MSTDNQPVKFEWTDELVKEFADNVPVDEMSNDTHIQQFKASKQPKQERIEISDIFEANTNIGRKTYRGYAFTSTSLISTDKFPEIKQAIESVLNNDTEDKDSIKIRASYWKQVQDDLRFLEAELDANQDKIYTQSEVDTIRRETWEQCRKFIDGHYFYHEGFKYPTLSDYLSSLNSKDTGKEYKESWAGQQEKVKEEKMKELAKKIYSEQPTNDNAFVWTDALVMEIIGLTHRAGYHKEPARVYERIQSFKQSKQSAPPIVKDKEVIWFVNQYWELHSKIKDTHHPADNDKNITVKDKEAGEQYILENKPCLSLKDLFLLGITEHHPYYKMLSELVKQKLSK